MISREDVIVANLASTASETFAGETVIIHFERGTYFSLRGSAGAIWSLLQVPTSVAAIVKAASERNDIKSQDLELLLTDFVSRLVAANLLIEVAGNAEVPSLAAETIANFIEPAILETYDDLAELIAMDPVHEVDLLTGWPHRS
jgi:hypothetical protein